MVERLVLDILDFLIERRGNCEPSTWAALLASDHPSSRLSLDFDVNFDTGGASDAYLGFPCPYSACISIRTSITSTVSRWAQWPKDRQIPRAG